MSYFIKGGFWLSAGTLVTTIGGIFLSSLFARFWPKDVYGQFTFIISAIGFLSITTLPSLSQVLIQSVAEGKEATYRVATKTLLKWSLIGTTLLLLGSLYFFLRNNTILSIAAFITALAFPLYASTSLFSSYLMGKKNFRAASFYSTFSQVVTILFTALALWKAGYLLIVVFCNIWTPAIIKSLITLKYLKSVKKAKVDKTYHRLGIALSISGAMMLGIDYFDRFAIPLFLSFEANASWAIALIIPLQIHSILKILLDLAQPKIAELKKGDFRKILLKKSFQLEILVGAAVVLYIIFAEPIFKLLYPQYMNSVNISRIYAVSLLYFPNNLFGFFLIKRRVTNRALISSVIYTVVSAFSLLIFIWLWGLIGAAISKIFARIILIIITQVIFSQELRKIRVQASEK